MSGFKLKLNTSSSNNHYAPNTSTPVTPLVTPGGSKPVLKFKISSSNPQSPAGTLSSAQAIPRPKKTKAGRAPKLSAKAQDSLKRSKSESPEDDTIHVQPPVKKLKLSIGGPKTPIASSSAKTPITGITLKPKIKGKPPKRLPGEGYDSEASDVEVDPAIEEQFILRMLPGDDCEYLRNAIDQKRIGIPKSQGGPDIHMKFFHGDGRRAAVTIRRNVYAATLVDLPTIIEGMKSWDKRGWWKSADICQMLWVFAKIHREEEAKTIALPSIVDPQTFQYPHGLTAPMHYARKRRFRKRISRTAIEAVEDAVDKLLKADAQAEETRWEMIDPDRHGSSAFSPGGSSPPPAFDDNGVYSEDEDAEGELDDEGYFGNGHGHLNGGQPHQDEIDDADLAADLEAAMEAEELETATPATPASTLAATPSNIAGETPIPQEDEFDSGDESIEGEDEEDENAEKAEVDEDEKNRFNEIQGIKSDILELEKQYLEGQQKLSMQQNPILKRRLEDSLRRIKNEIQLKQSAIGDVEEGDE